MANKKEFLDVPFNDSITEILKVNKIVKVFKEKSLKRVGKGAERIIVFFLHFKKSVKEARDFYRFFEEEFFSPL